MKIAIQTINVEFAEFIDPAHNTMHVRLTNGSWLTFEKQKDRDAFEAILSHPEMKVWEYGEKMRADIEAATKKAVEKKFKEAFPSPVTSPPVVPPPAPVDTTVAIVNTQTTEQPTVAVVMPVEVSPTMELVITNQVTKPDPKSIDPQVEVTLVPVETLSPEMLVGKAETPDSDAANIVVAVQPEVAKILAVNNVDAIQVVTEAMVQAPVVIPSKEVEALPDVSVTPQAEPEAPQPFVNPPSVIPVKE